MKTIEKMLTRTIRRKVKGKEQVDIILPNEKLVYGVKFAIGMTVCLSVLQIAHMAFLGSWNSEVFAATTGLSGTVIGIIVGARTN